MHIAGGAANRFVLDRPMAAAAAPMGLAGHGAAGLSSLLNEGLARAIDHRSGQQARHSRRQDRDQLTRVYSSDSYGHRARGN